MKNRLIIQFFTITIILFSFVNKCYSQCSMCAATIETSANEGSFAGKGLNSGILYLMLFPYILVGIIGFMWYKKRKQLKQ